MQTAYILSCETPDKGGGIYEISLMGKEFRQTAYFLCDRPMYAVKEKNELFVLLRQPFQGSMQGGCFSMDLDLKNPSEIRSTEGVVPCHLCVDGKDCYVVNYLSGNLVQMGKKKSTHTGKGVNPTRQNMPHTHQAIFSPDKKYLLCCDLGIDTLFCYDRDLNLISQAKVEDGYGIRHAVFSKDGKYIYAISEMIPALHIFSFEGGRVALKGKMPIPCKEKKGDGAAIRLSKDGSKVYVSLRVENAICVYAVNGEKVVLLQKTDCGGDSPRDFQIVGEYLLIANEKSDSVIIYRLKKGLLAEKKQEIHLPNPLCCAV